MRCGELRASRARASAWEKELDGWSHERDDWSLDIISRGGGRMHPRRILRELELAMPKHVMVSTDIGNICSVSNSYLRFDEPNSMLAAMSFGNCGAAGADRGWAGPIVRPWPMWATAPVHELPGTADLRARAHSGDGGGVP